MPQTAVKTVDTSKGGISELFGSAKLEKAKLYRLKKGLELGESLTVQFNPAEYQITRGLAMNEKSGIGRDPDINQLQAVKGRFATLALTLYFDTITDLESVRITQAPAELKKELSGLTSAKQSASAQFLPHNKEPQEVCQEFLTLLKYNDEAHAPLKVRFIWGKFDFMGYVSDNSVTYTMFAPDGTPIRARVQLSIRGEETAILQQKQQRTFNSPNRTKERILTEGEPLWLLAEREYNDPSLWRVIAQANNILNPRKLNEAAVLKVPSIR